MPHAPFLHRCLELAERGRGRVGNGALVGAVLVREGKILAEGFHAGFGLPHAERALLSAYSGEVLPTDTLYVNLEPCQPAPNKKNPPCTDILLERGVKRVVVGMVDPDPRVAGEGITLLRQKGVTVGGPFERTQSERFNRGFVSVRVAGRPWITLKSARTQDGRVANPDGSPLAITSSQQNAWSHRFLRARHDAILVGVHTVVCDNPQLSIRHTGKSENQSTKIVQPIRIILDPHLRVPSDARVVTDAEAARTILVTALNRVRDAPKEAMLKSVGVRILEIGMNGDTLNWDALWSGLTQSEGEYHGLTSILVEGGTRTWERFRAARMLDEEVMLLGT